MAANLRSIRPVPTPKTGSEQERNPAFPGRRAKWKRCRPGGGWRGQTACLRCGKTGRQSLLGSGDARTGNKVARAAREDELASIEEEEAVAIGDETTARSGGHEQGPAAAARLPELVRPVLSGRRVKAVEGVIEEEDRTPARHRGHETEAPEPGARQAGCGLIEDLDSLAMISGQPGGRGPRPLAAEQPTQLGQPLVAVAGGGAGLEPGEAAPRREPVDVMAEHPKGARLDGTAVHQAVQQSRFAGTFVADDENKFARGDGEGQPVEDPLTLADQAELIEFDGGEAGAIIGSRRPRGLGDMSEPTPH